MEVYRVENKHGDGPYRSEFRVDSMSLKHSDAAHPTPIIDGIKDQSSNKFCGFKSLDDLKRWFDGEDREALDFIGYHVSMYRVPDNVIDHGTCQLMFPKEDAILLSIMNLLTFDPQTPRNPRYYDELSW